jgi:hypothetical protein
MESKKCSRCKQVKKITEYYLSKNKPISKCISCTKEYQKQNPQWNKWYAKNKEKRRIYEKEYRDKNREKINQQQRERHRKRLQDPIYNLKHAIRSNIGRSWGRCLNGNYHKSKKTEEILGCTLDEFIKYLQSQFTEGMVLENHGEWEVDHIIPLSNAKNEDEVIKLNHYTNFQPLWKMDNRKKYNKIA